MELVDFISTNWYIITGIVGIALGYVVKWAQYKVYLKDKVNQIADVTDALRDAIADDNVSANEAIGVLNKLRILVGLTPAQTIPTPVVTRMT